MTMAHENLQRFAVFGATITLLGMSIAAIQEHRIAYNYFGAFAALSVFSLLPQVRVSVLSLRAAFVAAYLLSVVALGLAEVGMLSLASATWARWACITFLTGLLFVGLFSRHRSSHEA